MNELVDLELFEVSLVDEPANKEAMIALFKRDNSMDEVEKLKEEVVALKDEIEVLKGKLLSAETEKEAVEKAAKVDKEETIEVDGEVIQKSSLPASVIKRLEEAAQKEELEKFRAEVAKTIPNFVGKEDAKIALIKSVTGNEDLLTLLKAADALFAEKTKEVGSSSTDGDMQSAEDKFEAMVKAKMVSDKIGYHKAYSVVALSTEGRSLLKEISKKS